MSDFAECRYGCHMIKSTNFTVFNTKPESAAAWNVFDFLSFLFIIISNRRHTPPEPVRGDRPGNMKTGEMKKLVDKYGSLCYNTAELNEAACFELKRQPLRSVLQGRTGTSGKGALDDEGNHEYVC